MHNINATVEIYLLTQNKKLIKIQKLSLKFMLNKNNLVTLL